MLDRTEASVPKFAWTEANVAHLRARYGDEAASDIAATLGCTEKAVIGKAFRLRLKSNRHTGTEWNDEQVQYLRDHYSSTPASEIAKVLGCSPGAAIKKAFRLGLQSNVGMKRRAVAEGPRIPKVKFVDRSFPLPDMTPCQVEGLTAFNCHFPIGLPGDDNFHFCGGAATPGKPYCAAHCAIAYVTPKKAEMSAP